MKLRAACVILLLLYRLHPQPQFSRNGHEEAANLSCMDVKAMVSLACSHRCGVGEHLVCQAGRRRWLKVENYWPACQQHLRFPFPWDHQVRLGLAGTMVLQEEDQPLQLPPPLRFTISGSSLFVRRGSSTVSPAPSGPARGLALR